MNVKIIKLFDKSFDIILTIYGIILYHVKYKRFSLRSQKKIDTYQYKRLKKLLIKSRNIPYYRDLYKSINFNPRKDFNSLEDLNKLPILKKETVRNNPTKFLNNKIWPSLYFYTSGTTGAPLRTRVSTKHWVIEQAVIWRHWKWANFKLFDPMAIIRSHNPSTEEEIIRHDRLRNWTYYSPYHLSNNYMQKYYSDMIRRRIKFLRGYPSSLSIFAEFCRRNNYTIPTLKACFTASEVLTIGERAIIEKTFNVKVFDHYGLAEAIIMLHNDGSNNNYMNCEEYGYLELIETENPKYYKIVGTNLNNFSMPLVRYDTDDIAEITKDINNKKIVMNIIGRKDQYIKTKTRLIPTVNFYTTLYKVPGITQWQIIQNNNSLDIYLKIEQDSEFVVITKLIDKLNFTELDFHYHETEIFSLTAEGKLKPFVSNL